MLTITKYDISNISNTKTINKDCSRTNLSGYSCRFFFI